MKDGVYGKLLFIPISIMIAASGITGYNVAHDPGAALAKTEYVIRLAGKHTGNREAAEDAVRTLRRGTFRVAKAITMRSGVTGRIPGKTGGSTKADKAVKKGEKTVDINSATEAELSSLPKISSETAKKIIALRMKMNGFSTVEELAYVDGIGKATIEKLKPCVVVQPYSSESDAGSAEANAGESVKAAADTKAADKSKNAEDKTENAAESGKMVNINTATLGELMTIRGIGSKRAQKIIEKRNELGGFSRVEDLKKVDGIGDKIFEDIKDKITVE